MIYLYAGAGILILLLGAAVKVQSSRLDTCKTEHAAFVAQVKAAGDAQESATKLKDEQNKLAKEKSDAQNAKAKRDLAGLYDAYGKLLDTNSRLSQLPQAAPGSTSPADITFDRASLDRGLAVADGILQSGAAKILRRGDEAITDLDTGKTWAQQAVGQR